MTLDFHNNKLPKGAKLWLLNLGYLDIEATELVAGTNIQMPGRPAFDHQRRDLVMIGGLLLHPDVGLVLFDVGSTEDIIKNWDPQVVECTPRIWDKQIHSLPAAIAATGAGTIRDVKAVVLSHLHFDHAGGLENFLDTDVEIWCHEEELKYAYWAASIKIDSSYYPHSYLLPHRLNWKTFQGQNFNIWPGVMLHHTPGHTPGSIMMELSMEHSGTVLFTGDLFHVKENWEDGIPQTGSLMRDYSAWARSSQFAKRLAAVKRAKVILGHEGAYFDKFPKSPQYLE